MQWQTIKEGVRFLCPTTNVNTKGRGDQARRGEAAVAKCEQSVWLIDSAGDSVIDYTPMGADARGVFVNDALIDQRAFVLVGIPRESRCGSTCSFS